MADVPKVFCSYRSVDSERVRKVATELTKAGIDPWLYEWEVQAGEDFVPAINKALAECELALIFFSKATPEGAWTQKEISSLTQQAVDLKKRVIPVLLEADAPIPALLKTHVKVRADAIDDLIDAIHGVSKKPKIRQRKRNEHTVRLSVGRPDPAHLSVTCVIDGESIADEQTVRISPDFAFSYADWLKAHYEAERQPTATASTDRTGELRKLGQALGAVLFPEDVDSALRGLLDKAATSGRQIEFVVETGEPDLLSIPFEAVSLSDRRTPALETGVRLLRRYTAAEIRQQPQPGPLKILVAVGAPDEGTTQSSVLDSERELQTILDAVEAAREHGAAYVRILEVGSLDEIRKELRRQPYHVLHLSGHGHAGVLELETEDGEPGLVTGKQIAEVIRDSGHTAPLVFLAACHGGLGGAKGKEDETETTALAQTLLESGVPLVLAMQSKVSDRYSTDLAGRLYAELATATPLVSRALARARSDLERERNEAAARGEIVPPAEYATASLFSSGEERPLLDIGSDPSPVQEYKRPPVVGEVPMLKIGDLIDRREEVRDVVWLLTEHPKNRHGRKAGYQLIGIGGVGKSSVAGRAMQRLSDDGWHVVAHSGHWELGSLCASVGAALLTAEDELKKFAKPLMGNIPDQARLQLVGQLLTHHRFLLVLDNFEDNLTPGGREFKNDFSRQALEAFCRAAQTGKLLITSRYPVPGIDAWLATEHVGPLSPAQSRKLVLRLEALGAQEPASLALVQRVIGGHPRMLEYLDAILRKGEARLPDVENRLKKQLKKLNIDLEEASTKFEEAVSIAEKVGAGDILLDELLAIAAEHSEDVEVLHQLAVFPMAVEASGLAFCRNGEKPAAPEEIRAVRKALDRLAALSLVTPRGDEGYWVHRWTAEALKKRAGEEAYREYCRRAGMFLDWHARNESEDLAEYVEAVRLLLRGRAFDEAAEAGERIGSYLEGRSRVIDMIAFCREVCAELPEDHGRYHRFLLAQADAQRFLGLTEDALSVTREVTQVLEVLTKAEPNRADYQRDLSVSYEKLGDLLRSLGEGDEARAYHEKSLAIRERLAAAEPNRADYQRDLSVSYEKLGDLLRSLGEGEQARAYHEKSLAIRERLAAAEPNRADYQRDLSVSFIKLGDLLRSLGEGEQARAYYEKSLAIRERLAAAEPNRADYQRDLSVSFIKLGDLLRSLGEGEQARAYYEKSLAIAERLAAAEPNRADYQRDLSVSFNKLGDLLRSLGEGEQARAYYEKSLAIRERLAAAEPNRADYQTDLVVSLMRVGRRQNLERALHMLEPLEQRGALTADQRRWPGSIRQRLDDLSEGAGA